MNVLTDTIDPMASTIASGINTIIKVCELSSALNATKEQTTALLSVIEHVERNITEAERLIRQKSALLSPEEKSWMQRQIADTQDALRRVAELVEEARVSISNNGSVSLKTKAVWVYKNNLEAEKKTAHLSFCAGTLNSVISALYSKDVIVAQPVQQAPVKEEHDTSDGLPTYAMSELRARRKRKTRTVNSGEMQPTMLSPSLEEPDIDERSLDETSSGPLTPLVTVAPTATAMRDNRANSMSSSVDNRLEMPRASFSAHVRASASSLPLDSSPPDRAIFELPEVAPRRPRRSWKFLDASRSNLGHSSR
ncbi:MAG: hypothetical protein Q9160_008721 [Pyrenula sp. 1 TL-2023]